MEFSAEISKNCHIVNSYAKGKKHTGMKRTLMPPVTDITGESPFMISTNYNYSWRCYHADWTWQTWNNNLYICAYISPFCFPLQVVGYLLTILL